MSNQRLRRWAAIEPELKNCTRVWGFLPPAKVEHITCAGPVSFWRYFFADVISRRHPDPPPLPWVEARYYLILGGLVAGVLHILCHESPCGDHYIRQSLSPIKSNLLPHYIHTGRRVYTSTLKRVQLNNFNFHRSEVVSRCHDPQLQVGENYSHLFNLRRNSCKF